MKTIEAKDWDGKRAAWLWEETGDGSLAPVRYIRSDWWIVTGTGVCQNSWCCHPGTTLYVGTPEEAKGQEQVLRDNLKERRARWARERRATYESRTTFREEECGGVFDGSRVISDADPGL